MLTINEYKYVNARARGMTPVEAYMAVHPESTRESAVKNYSRYEEKEEIVRMVQEFIAVDKSEAAEVRREVVAGYLRDSRDETMPLPFRFKAREALVKIYGMEKTQVEVSADDAFRKFLMGQN